MRDFHARAGILSQAAQDVLLEVTYTRDSDDAVTLGDQLTEAWRGIAGDGQQKMLDCRFDSWAEYEDFVAAILCARGTSSEDYDMPALRAQVIGLVFDSALDITEGTRPSQVEEAMLSVAKYTADMITEGNIEAVIRVLPTITMALASQAMLSERVGGPNRRELLLQTKAQLLTDSHKIGDHLEDDDD